MIQYISWYKFAVKNCCRFIKLYTKICHNRYNSVTCKGLTIQSKTWNLHVYFTIWKILYHVMIQSLLITICSIYHILHISTTQAYRLLNIWTLDTTKELVIVMKILRNIVMFLFHWSCCFVFSIKLCNYLSNIAQTELSLHIKVLRKHYLNPHIMY